VPLEAVSSGTPVIVRNLGGMPEVVEDSGAGFIYNTDEDLVSAMDALLDNSVYRNKLGQRGYEAYRKNWSIEVHLQRYFNLIHEIAALHKLPLALKLSTSGV